MHMRKLGLLTLAAIWTSGCLWVSSSRTYEGSAEQPPYVRADPVADPATSADLQSRLQAAKGMTSFTQRDAALQEIAISAAAIGDVTTTRNALSDITSFTVRDQASQSAAMALANCGRRNEAIEIASGMTSFTMRDQTLARLAQR